MWKKCFEYVKANIPPFLHEFARWVRYLYFLRFSIILWYFRTIVIHETKISLRGGISLFGC